MQLIASLQRGYVQPVKARFFNSSRLWILQDDYFQVTYQFSAVSINTLRALTHYLKRAPQPANMKLWMRTIEYCDIYVTN